MPPTTPTIAPAPTTTTSGGGETLAQMQARVANQGKPGFDVFGNPVAGTPRAGGGADAPPATEPTVLSSATKTDTTIPQNNATLATYPKAGATAGQDGYVRNADASFAEAPSDAVQNPDGSWSSGGLSYAIGPSGGKLTSDPFTQSIFDQFTTLKQQMDATSAQQIENIKNTYAYLIDQQQRANAGQEAAVNALLLRGGSEKTASSAGIYNTQVSYGLSQISDLQNKENAAVIAAQQAQQTGDMTLLDKQLSIAQEANKAKQDAAAKLNDTLLAQRQKQQDQIDQANKDNAVQSLLSQGITDPAEILKQLEAGGVTNISAKDIADTIANLNPDAKNIMSIMQTATENNAPSSVLAAIGNAKNYSAALQAGAGWISTNSNVQEYNQYRSQATAKGQNPVSFDSWMNAQEYNKAFAAAQGAAAGKVAGEGAAGAGVQSANIKTKTDFPQKLQPYAKESATGTWYLDLSSIGANLRPALIDAAGDVPVITDKNQANDLINIKDANSKLQTIANVMRNLNSPSALSRDLGGAGLTTLAALAQTNPKAAAATALNDAALDILKGISGVQGFRGNQAAIQQVKDALPKMTDTQDVTAQKLQTVAGLIQDRENATLGTTGPIDTTDFVIRTEDQAKQAIIKAGQQNPEVQKQITQLLGTNNPDTGQPYSYLEVAQIQGIDIPELSNSPYTFF